MCILLTYYSVLEYSNFKHNMAVERRTQSVMGLRYSYEPQKVPSVARWSRSSVGHSL